MSVDFKNSKTRVNLMKAFAGESQARNRYYIAAGQAKKQNLKVIELILKFTADQEEEHAKIFYKHLTESAGETIDIEGGYPVDISENVAELLRFAQHNEYEEHDDVYKEFAEIAKEEGFDEIYHSFSQIAKIEKTHGERFGEFAELLENDKLYVSDVVCEWICLNCGHIIEGKMLPEKCPVCQHDRGYYIRLELAPYSCKKC